MLVRSSVFRRFPQCCVKVIPPACRGMAAATTNPFYYTVGEAAGVKFAARDDGGSTTSLAVVVRGGSRYETAPGLAHGLTNFAFKNTTKRSALRLQRESELLGGMLDSKFSRENIVLRAKFFRNDLPYFMEALADIITNTKYLSYEFSEEVGPKMAMELGSFAHDPASIADEHGHNIAFHSGLGKHRLAVSNKFVSNFLVSPYTSMGNTLHLTADHINNLSIPGYARQVYQKGNIAVVASGAPAAEVEKWTKQFFTDVHPGSGLSSSPTKYFGGENRVYNASGDALVIAFPGSAGGLSYKPEISVLAHLLGGQSSIKWNPGTSALSQALAQIPNVKALTRHTAYTDAGLLSITITGAQKSLGHAGSEVVKAINSLANVKPDEVKKAIAQAKYELLASVEDRSAGLELVGQSVIASGKAPQVEDSIKALESVTVNNIQNAVKSIIDVKATYAVVGDLHFLPFAADIGLKV